jgi:N-dimethylarginine dimethylaminohydrolase
MAAPQRAGEERHTALALAEQGIPILHTTRGSGLLEGADALWLNDGEVLVGVGHRTNSLGCDQLEEVLAEQGVQVLRTSVHPGVQHLLGMVNLVRTDLAVVHGGAADDDLLDTLRRKQIQALVLEPDRELTEGRSNNFVTLEPSRVVLPSNCPRTREILENHGIQTHEVDVSQYLHAAGGPGCVTGIVRRG